MAKKKYGKAVIISTEEFKRMSGIPNEVEFDIVPHAFRDGISMKFRNYKGPISFELFNEIKVELVEMAEGQYYPVQKID